MKVFISYLRYSITSLLLLCIFSLVFTAVSLLSGLSFGNTLYSLGLCLFISAIFIWVRFSRFRARHRKLCEMRDRVIYTLDGLGDGENLIERDYTELVHAVFDEKTRVSALSAEKETNLTDYYGMWTHQIKTPLAAMRLILQSEEPDRDSLAHELFLTEQYADMAMQYLRADSSSTDYLIKKCALDGIVRRAVRKFAPLFIRKKIHLNYIPTDETVLTDEKWLLFVIEQVLSNSLKYTPEGGNISVSTQDGVLCITDDGIGIKSEDVPRVFDKSYTGYNGRIDRKSSGIGLYLCKKVCDRIGHGIYLDSEEGKGTTVKIDLNSDNLERE